MKKAIKEKIDMKSRYYFAYTIILLVILLFQLGKLTQPYFTDEVGYWAFAAWINGIDWSSVMAKIGYYGYGYGVLLAPLFLLKDPYYMFCGAVVLNAVMVVGLFTVLNFILKELYANIDYKTRMLAAFIPCCYTYIVVYSHLTMCEILLTLLSAIYLYLMILINKRITVIRTILLALTIGLLIAVHLKSLIFIGITGIYFVAMFWMDKKKWKQLLVMAASIALLVAVAFLLKELVVKEIYTDPLTQVHESYNDDISDKIGTLDAYLNLRFVQNFFMCLIAKVFYLSVSSLGFFNFAMASIIREVHTFYKEKDRKKIGNSLILLITIVVWLLFSAFISGKTEIGRVDNLLYGRYIESVLPLFLSLGVLEFLQTDKRKHTLLRTMCCCLGIGMLCYHYLVKLGFEGMFPTMLPMQISGVVGWPGIKTMDKSLAVTLYAVLLFCFMGVGIHIISEKSTKAAVYVCAALWIFGAYNGMNQYVYNTYETVDVAEESKLVQFEIIQGASNYLYHAPDDVIYYVINSDGSTNASYYQMYDLQYDLVDKPLTVITYEQFLELPSNSLVVVNSYQNEYKSVKSMLRHEYKNRYFYIGRKMH